MDILLIYNLVIYLILRCLGFGISLDFYYNTRQSRFKLALIGWGLWVLASVLSILSGFISNYLFIDLFLFLNSFFVALATIFYIWTIFTYFLDVPDKPFIIALISLTVVLLVSYIAFNYSTAINLAVIIVSFILLSVYIVPILNWKKFKENMGVARKWYYMFLISLAFYIIISIYISSQGLGYYGIYSTVNVILIILNYVPSIIYYIILIVLIIHVEYNYSHKQRFELKDKYSHDLGNILQFITGYIDLTSQKDNLENKNKLELSNMFTNKCKEAADLIQEIREL
jgi:hypothetical protein